METSSSLLEEIEKRRSVEDIDTLVAHVRVLEARNKSLNLSLRMTQRMLVDERVQRLDEMKKIEVARSR